MLLHALKTKSYKHIPTDNNFSFGRELSAMEKVKRKGKKINFRM